MKRKYFLLIIISVFYFNTFSYSLGLFSNISKNLIEWSIKREIQKGNFETASEKLEVYHLKYSENFASQFYGFLIFSDKFNNNYSLLQSYRYLYLVVENYKTLKDKQKELYNKKFRINETLLQSSINTIQKTLLSEYANSSDSIKTLLNYFLSESIVDKSFNLILENRLAELSLLTKTNNKEKISPLNDQNQEFNKITDSKSGCILFLDKNINNLTIVWKGKCIDGFAEDDGECQFFRNNKLIYTYQGKFTKGKINYPITILYPDGSKYVGILKNDKFHLGSYTFPDGSIQTGYWINAKLNGQGTSTSKNGSIYDGEWKDGDKNGKGTLTLTDGSKYTGTWHNNMLTGPFSYIFENGTEFKGTIHNDIIDKNGTCIFQNGSIYTGEFLDFEFHGKGKLTKTNGESYEGEWKNNIPYGYGVYVFADGSKYIGEWTDGQRNGNGEYIFQNGSKYIGQWKNNEMYGQGTMSMIEGETYTGEWKNGEKYGNGTYILIDGSKHIGFWNGKRMKSGQVYNGKGELVYDGDMENYYR